MAVVCFAATFANGGDMTGPEALSLLENLRDGLVLTAGAGRGVALTTTMEGGIEEEKLVKFCFLGESSSRSDSFEFHEGNVGKQVKSWVRSGNASTRLHFREGKGASSATINKVTTSSDARSLGADFHPTTWTAVGGSGLKERLGRIVKMVKEGKGICTASIDEQGVLRFRYDQEFSDSDREVWIECSIGTQNGYQLLSWESVAKGINGPHSMMRLVTDITWKAYGSSVYPEKASYRKEWLAAVHEGDPGNRRPDVVHRTTRILEFDPNAAVAAAEFKLSGMDMPIGASVRNLITGISYKYGGEIVQASELADILNESALLDRPNVTRSRPTTMPTQGRAADSESSQLNDEDQHAQPSRAVWYSAGAGIVLAILIWIAWCRDHGTRRRSLTERRLP